MGNYNIDKNTNYITQTLNIKIPLISTKLDKTQIKEFLDLFKCTTIYKNSKIDITAESCKKI